jgi:hypothetical protein
MAIHLGTITVKSKSAWDLIIRRWKESKLQKVRLILAISSMVVSFAAMYDFRLGPFTLPAFLTAQLIAVFWPELMGLVVRPILLRAAVLVPAEPRTKIVIEYHYDAAWFFYEMTPELHDWYKANCVGWMGVIPEREIETRQGRRLFWFTNKNDAFAFRMRWAGI